MADRRMFSREIFKSSVMINLGRSYPEAALESQRVFETLILTADDYGRGRLIPEVIMVEAFVSAPAVLKIVTPDLIEAWISSIESQGAVITYEVDGDRYYQLTGWDTYQRGGWQKGNSNIPACPGYVEHPAATGQPADGARTDSGQDADTGRTADESKVNQSKSSKKNKTAKPADVLPGWCIELVEELFPTLKSMKDDTKKETVDKFAEVNRQAATIDKLNRLKPFHPQYLIESVLRWAITNVDDTMSDWPGWSSQFLSCCQLRSKKDGVMKFAKIKAGYDSHNTGTGSNLVIG